MTRFVALLLKELKWNVEGQSSFFSVLCYPAKCISFAGVWCEFGVVARAALKIAVRLYLRTKSDGKLFSTITEKEHTSIVLTDDD